MRIQTGSCLAAMTLMLLAENVYARDDDRAAILALMERAFDAVSSGSVDDWRAIQLAEGTSISFRPQPGGDPGDLEMRIATNEAIAAAGVDDDHEYIERWTSDPIVMIHGPIAVVWGEYEFRIDGEFSHCGVDAADVIKMDGTWKIANWMWTVEKENCPGNPS